MNVILTQLLILAIPPSFQFLTSSAVGATELGCVIQLIKLVHVTFPCTEKEDDNTDDRNSDCDNDVPTNTNLIDLASARNTSILKY